MSSSSFARVNQLFHAALELPEAEREHFLKEECGDDEALKRRLIAMLDQDALARENETEDPLAAAVLGGQKQYQTAHKPLPEQIGPFKLLRKLGQGGMGTIYLGQRSDSDFDQRVAIKFLRDLDGTALTSARLRRERRVLASLEHPNIARLIDGGELDDGTPYVVMEYVEGVSLTRYADDHELGLTARLRLFQQLLQAIAYAHRNLIVHRDIKPDNVLVDAEGKVKLLDFGIAKLLDKSDSSLAGATMTIAAAMTPCYASPEQLLGQAVSTQTDVYSLGVVLYELLTGSLPFGPDPALSELQLKNQICTTQAIAPSKVQEPVTPHRRLRGDLDNIVLKALRKEPLRRYDSVDAFNDDIRNYLAGRPVSARPDSWTYRSSKFVTRNPLGFAVSLLLLTTLLAFAITSRWQAQRFAAERDRAETEAVAARQVAEYMIDLFQVPDPIESANRDLTAKDMLDKAATSLPDEMADAPLLRARMMHVIGLSYANMGDYKQAIKLLDSSLAIRESELGPDSLEVSDSLNRIGNIYRMYGQLDLAEQALNRMLNIRENSALGDNEDLADAYNNFGLLQYQLGQYSRALITLQKAIDMHRRLSGENTLSIAVALHNRSLAFQGLARYAEAEAEIRRAIEIKEFLGMQDRSTYYNSQAMLSVLLFSEGRLNESLELRATTLAKFRELYPQGHPSLVSGLIGLGNLRLMLGDAVEAGQLFDEAWVWANRIDSSSRSMAVRVLVAQGRLALATGELERARETLEQALEILSASSASSYLKLAETQYLAGVAALADADTGRAGSLLQSALQERQQRLPARHPDVRETRLALAAIDARNGDIETARTKMSSVSLDISDSRTLRNDLVTAQADRCLAELPVSDGKDDSGTVKTQPGKAAHDLLAKYFHPDHPLLNDPAGQCPGVGWLPSER